MDPGTRGTFVMVRREEQLQNPNLWEYRDSLVCELISFSAGLIEAGRLNEAGAAIGEAENHLTIITKLLELAGFHGDFHGRVHVLTAACKYNSSIIFFEAGLEDHGYEWMSYSRQVLNATATEDKQRELYLTAESALQALEAAVQNVED